MIAESVTESVVDSWIPTDIELPHFGRLPIRVLVCDALSCRAQGSHTEHSVNLTIPEVTTMSPIRSERHIFI